MTGPARETSRERRARRGRAPFLYRVAWEAARTGATSAAHVFAICFRQWHDCGGVCFVPTCHMERCQRAQRAASRGRVMPTRRR